MTIELFSEIPYISHNFLELYLYKASYKSLLFPAEYLVNAFCICGGNIHNSLHILSIISHPQNAGCNHICGVSIKNIGKMCHGSPIAVPMLFIIKSPHVPPDTKHFFIRKAHVLLQHNHRLFPMSRKKGCIVIFPRFIPRMSVIINLTQIMEHTHNIGAALFHPR